MTPIEFDLGQFGAAGTILKLALGGFIVIYQAQNKTLHLRHVLHYVFEIHELLQN
jgi:hypothetical protein